jgi:hypothetical protein
MTLMTRREKGESPCVGVEGLRSESGRFPQDSVIGVIRVMNPRNFSWENHRGLMPAVTRE